MIAVNQHFHFAECQGARFSQTPSKPASSGRMADKGLWAAMMRASPPCCLTCVRVFGVIRLSCSSPGL